MCSILKTTAIVHLNLQRGIPNVYEQRRERCNGSLMIKNLAHFYSLTRVYRVLGFVEEFFSI